MKKYVTASLKSLATALEMFIAALLAVGIIVMTVQLVLSIDQLSNLNTYPNYNDFLTTCLNLIIGVEMIRMLYLHTPMTIFEVLLFAIARQVIIDHSSPINSLLGVISIAVLFATRKFLFVTFDETERIIFRATQKVRLVNRLIHTHIPYKDDESLRDVMHRKMQEDNVEVGVGACIYYPTFGLRIAKISNGEITRIEVIRSIQ